MHIGGATSVMIYAHHIDMITTISNKENPFFFFFGLLNLQVQ
jgi:hypothetical protein